MKTIKEIRNEANALYNKSSHYIAETFISIGAVVAISKSLLDLIGMEIGIDMLFILSMLFSPFELGMIKAALLSYDHRAREVKTVDFTLLGLKNYGKIFIPFVGRTLIVYAMQALILTIFVLLSSGSLELVPTFLKAVLSGSLDGILQNTEISLTLGMLAGVVVTLVLTFIVEAYFSLSYYYVVEDDMGLFESLSESTKRMKGNLARYIGIKISYIPMIILASAIVSAITMALSTMFAQLLTIVPVPLIVFNIILVAITGLVSAFVSVMFYKVKETLAITIFYKDLRKNAE